MAQIVTNKAIADRCNLSAITEGGSKSTTILGNNEVWLVDTLNLDKGTKGFGKYDSYIIGDGIKLAKDLLLFKIDELSNELGNSELKGITQKKITEEIEGINEIITEEVQALNQKIDSIDPESIVTVRYKTTYPEVPSRADVGDYWIYDNTLNVCIEASEYDPKWKAVIPFANKLYLYNNIIFRYISTTFIQVGEQGPQGEKGDIGLTGPKGEKGNPGTTLEAPVEIFQDLSDLGGKSTEVQLTMVSSGNTIINTLKQILPSQTGNSAEIGLSGVTTNNNSHLWITDNGEIYVGTWSGISNARVTYLKTFKKGDLFRIHREMDTTSGRGNIIICGWTETDPSTLDTLVGLQLTHLYKGEAMIQDFTMVCPYDTGYLVYCWFYGSQISGKAEYTIWRNNLMNGDIDEIPVLNSNKPVTSNGLANIFNDLNTNLWGEIPILVKKTNSCIDWNAKFTTNGSWRSYDDASTYIFDVSGLRGLELMCNFLNRPNTYPWAFVKNWEDIKTKLAEDPEDETRWSVNAILKPTSRVASKVEYNKIMTVPQDASHLLLVYYNDDGMASVRSKNSLATRVELLETGSWKTSIDDYNPENEYLPKIKNMVHVKSGTKPLLLAHFSDIHGNSKLLERILSWCSSFSLIKDIVHTGDTCRDSFSSGMEFWDTIDGSENILNVVGNHDYSVTSDGSGGKLPVDVFGLIFATKYTDNWGATFPVNAAENGLCYWYKDYTTEKVRLIGLDNMINVKATGLDEVEKDEDNKTAADRAREAQMEWLQERLLEASNADLTVVIAYHSAPTNQYEEVKCNFHAYPASSYIPAYHYETMANIIRNFKAGKLEGQTTVGKFACWLCGHAHKDYVVWGKDQLIIGVDSMRNGDRANRVNDANEKSLDCFNLVGIDTYRHTVKLLRVGNDIDDQLREIDLCAIDYTTGEVLGNISNDVDLEKDIYTHIMNLCKKLEDLDFGGTITKSSLQMDSTGMIKEASDSSYKVYYYKEKMKAGTLVHFSADSTIVERTQRFALMFTDPSNEDSPIGIGSKLQLIFEKTKSGTWGDSYFVLPQEGWLVGYFYNSSWSGRSIDFYSLPLDNIGLLKGRLTKLEDCILNSPNIYTVHEYDLEVTSGLPNGDIGEHVSTIDNNLWKYSIIPLNEYKYVLQKEIYSTNTHNIMYLDEEGLIINKYVATSDNNWRMRQCPDNAAFLVFGWPTNSYPRMDGTLYFIKDIFLIIPPEKPTTDRVITTTGTQYPSSTMWACKIPLYDVKCIYADVVAYSGKYNNESVPVFAFFDVNDNIVDTLVLMTTTRTVRNIGVIVPEEASYVIIQSRIDTPAKIYLAEEKWKLQNIWHDEMPVLRANNDKGEHLYVGERINLNGWGFNTEIVGKDIILHKDTINMEAGLGGCIFNDRLLFRFHARGACRVYDITDLNNIVFLSEYQSAIHDIHSYWHANCVQFDSEINENSGYPHIWSSYVDDTDKTNVTVYKLAINSNGNSSFSDSIVQTVQLPKSIFATLQGQSNARPNVICGDDGYLWAFGGGVYSDTTPDYNRLIFAKFRKPSQNEGATVTLLPEDCIDSWIYQPYVYKTHVFQGGMVRNGKLYMVFGQNASVADSRRELWVFNCTTHERETVVNLSDISSYELEDCDVVNNKLLIVRNGVNSALLIDFK